MNKYLPVIFVDGNMEKIILQKIGVSAKIVTTNLNGKNVNICAITKKISSSIRFLNGRYKPIIIIIDREDREKTVDQIIQEFNSEFKKNKINEKKYLGVADRMTENWILADWESFKKNTGTNKKKSHISFEGINGKAIIKKYLPSYQETIDGVNLFIHSKASVMRVNSSSFNSFFSSIEHLDHNCSWLKK